MVYIRGDITYIRGEITYICGEITYIRGEITYIREVTINLFGVRHILIWHSTHTNMAFETY
jgi:hypothetical protein